MAFSFWYAPGLRSPCRFLFSECVEKRCHTGLKSRSGTAKATCVAWVSPRRRALQLQTGLSRPRVRIFYSQVGSSSYGEALQVRTHDVGDTANTHVMPEFVYCDSHFCQQSSRVSRSTSMPILLRYTMR